MKRAVGYGLVLLAASTTAARSALASVTGDADGVTTTVTVQFFMAGATTHSAQGYLGVDVRDVNTDQLTTLKLKDTRGAEIVLVDHDAPAGKAGLREHDIVLQMNGQAIDGQDQLRRMLHESPPGKTITLLISRDGQQLTVSAQMANREEVERQAWEQHLTVPEPTTPPNDATDESTGPSSPAPTFHGGNSFIGTLLDESVLHRRHARENEHPARRLLRSLQRSRPARPQRRSPIHPRPSPACSAGDVVLRADHTVTTTGDWAKALKNSQGQAAHHHRHPRQEAADPHPDARQQEALQPRRTRRARRTRRRPPRLLLDAPLLVLMSSLQEARLLNKVSS